MIEYTRYSRVREFQNQPRNYKHEFRHETSL